LNFFQELKRRNVFRVGAAYAIGAWLLAQVTDLVGENFDLPEWLVQGVLIALAVGLPVALVLAWVFELTPEGVKRESEVDRSQPGSHHNGRILDRLIIVALVVALGYFVWEARFSSSGLQQVEVSQAQPSQADSIAVLPFENFSANDDDEYFADGLADTLLHKLAQIRELKVIARNSSFQFKGTNRDIREIGQILGVSTVLEGSVQRYGEQVRVIAQLIDASDGKHIWSETFDDRMDNIFALQDKIAEHIVRQLQVNLSAEDLSRVLKDGTASTEAYDFYMLALAESTTSDELTETNERDFLRLRLLQRAVEADPGFVEAWAQIASSYSALAFLSESNDEFVDSVRKGREAAEKAIELDPAYHGGYVSLGFLDWRERRINDAVANYRKAMELNPNSAGAHAGLGLALVRSDPEEALRLFTRAGELDPNEPLIYRQKSFALNALGQYDEGMATLEQAAERFPDEFLFFADIAEWWQQLRGHPDMAAKWVSRYLAGNGPSLNASLQMASYWMLVDDQDRAAAWVKFAERVYGESDATLSMRRQMLQLRGRYAAALETDTSHQQAEMSLAFRWHAEGVQCLASEDYPCALERAERIIEAHEEFAGRGFESRTLNNLGLLMSGMAQLGLGNDEAGEDALQPLFEQFRDAQLMSSSFATPGKGYILAALHSIRGDTQAALDELETTLSLTGGAFIARDWLWSAPDYSLLFRNLRDNPAFLDWQARFRARRAAMHGRMVQWEQQGELITPEQLQ
jgi:TolB-like protein/Tfp pilus assembly protein PilF